MNATIEIEQDKMVTFARKYWLTPAQAVALPAVMTKAAEVGGIDRLSLINRAIADFALGSYLAGVCRQVT